MRRVVRKRLVEACKRFVDVAEFEKGVAEVEKDLGMARRKHQGVAIACYGLLEAPGCVQREAKV